MSDNTKRCPVCERRMLVSEFNKNVNKYDGLQSDCRECTNAQSAVYELQKTGNYAERIKKAERNIGRLHLLQNNVSIRGVVKMEQHRKYFGTDKS